jgi:hypothetical protein
MWEDIITIPMDVMKAYSVFRGHFLAYLEPYIGRKLATFTVLRNPVERTISHYCHVQRAPEHPFHSDARKLSLAEFCTHPRTPHMVQNYQARYLACPERKDPQALALTMTNDDLTAYKLELALDPSTNQFPAKHELYNAAYSRLRLFVAVGITERLRQSFELIARCLGWPSPPEFGWRNVGTNRISAVDEDVIRIIRECTDVDHALYADERRRFEQNLEELQSSRD